MGMIQAARLAYDYLKYGEEGTEPEVNRAIDHVDLDIAEGQFIAILGHNGSGKSTLAKHINGLLVPTEGTLWIDQMDTSDPEHVWDVRQRAGMVFQNPDNQIIGTVVEEDVGFGPENLGVPTEEIWRRVEESLKEVGMTAYRHHSPNKLSGGQKQRVAIAGVMAMRPKCIVLDEPTAMLDPNGRKEVLRAVRDLNRQEGVTVILITHYMEEVVFADHVFVMDQGHVVMQGTPREIFSQVDRLKAYRLDVPQVTLLAHELRAGGLDIPEGILTIPELTKAVLGEFHNRRQMKNARKEARGKAEPEQSEEMYGETEPERTEETCGKAEPEQSEEMYGKAESERTKETCGKAEPEQSEKTHGKTEPERTEEARGKTESGHSENLRPGASSIRLEHVFYTYSPNTVYEMHALKDVSLQIPQGQFVGIIGHTGSGKSTLIQHFNGLMHPTSGKVFFEEQDIWQERYPLRALRSQVGLVFQYPEHQLFETDVLTDVCFGPKNQNLSKEECEERAKRALKQVGLDERYYSKSPFELSGGQKRRAAIAGVLAMDPKLLILDEPTAGLDPKGRDEILDQIALLHRVRGITIILVSHSMEDIARYVERIIVMNHGEKMFDDTPEEVFAHYQELEAIGLAAPQITYIMHELAKNGLNADIRAITVEEAKTSILRAVQERGDV